MRIVVIGGSEGQLPCIAAGRRLGAKVFVVDPRCDVPGVDMADSWVPLDAADTPGITSQLDGEPIDAVVSDQSDYTARAAAMLAKRLGLPGQDLKLIDVCTNKFLMRSALAQSCADLLPRFEFFSSQGTAANFIRAQSEAVIVKPLRSQGSRGVGIATRETADAAVSRSFQESDGLGILVEQYLAGREFSIDGFVHEGAFTPLAIAAKSHYPTNPCLDERCAFLFSEYEAEEHLLVRSLQQIIRTLGIRVGIVHAELIVGAFGPKLVEIALRGGGSGISGIVVPALSGFDPAEALLRHLLDLPPMVATGDYHENSAILRFLPNQPVPRPEAAVDPSVDGWVSLTINPNAPTELAVPGSSDDRAGSFIVTTTNEARARAAEQDVLRFLGYPTQS